MAKRQGERSSQQRKKSRKEPLPESIPVTVLSGFLGSGKTTLLSEILRSTAHGLKIAVIVNDVAELNIDGKTIRTQSISPSSKPEVVTLENGCICCNLRGDLIREVYRIHRERQFDYVVIESTGIAEPQQVAESFCVDPETMALALGSEETEEEAQMLMKSARLDTCVTVVDALEFPKHLSSMKRFKEVFNDGLDNADVLEGEKSISELLVEQVEFANVVLLNKVDLVNAENLKVSKELIQTLNPKAQVVEGSFGKIDVTQILNTKMFNMEEASESPGWLVSLREHGVSGAPGESEEYGVSSFVYRSRTPFHPQRLHSFLTKLFCFARDWNTSESGKISTLFPKKEREELHEKYGTILRSKGTCWIAGREDHCFEWAQAGRLINISPFQAWFATTSEDEWGCESKEEFSEIRSNMQYQDDNGNDVNYKFGDRRQEIVFIGTKLRQAAIEMSLKECSLSETEMKNHAVSLPLGAYPDPLEPMLVDCDGPRSIFIIARENQNQHIRVLPWCSFSLQNASLLVQAADDMISCVRVWLDTNDSVACGILLATLRPIVHEQHSLNMTLMPCDENGGEPVTNRRIRVEVITKKPTTVNLMNACEVHLFGKVEPIPYKENNGEDSSDEDDEEEGVRRDHCATGECQ